MPTIAHSAVVALHRVAYLLASGGFVRGWATILAALARAAHDDDPREGDTQ